MGKKDAVVELVERIVGNRQTAEMLVGVLQDEGLLNLGYGDADIENVLHTFSKTFGTTKTSKYDRFAANRLVKQYGAQAVAGIIRLLGDTAGAEYAPVVNNVVELEKKWVSVLNFVRNRQKGSETIDNGTL